MVLGCKSRCNSQLSVLCGPGVRVRFSCTPVVRTPRQHTLAAAVDWGLCRRMLSLLLPVTYLGRVPVETSRARGSGGSRRVRPQGLAASEQSPGAGCRPLPGQTRTACAQAVVRGAATGGTDRRRGADMRATDPARCRCSALLFWRGRDASGAMYIGSCPALGQSPTPARARRAFAPDREFRGVNRPAGLWAWGPGRARE
jgi:hypothetical protein